MRPKKPESRRKAELLQAGQEQLVLHRAVLDAFGIGEPQHRDRLVEIGCDRLLAIDVLAGFDRLGQQRRARLRGGGIEEDGVVFVGQRLVEIGRPARHV